MKRLTLLLFAALAIAAVSGISAVSANAVELPSILWLTGTANSMSATIEGKEVARFNSSFATIFAEKFSIVLTANSETQMASLGPLDIHFTKSVDTLNGKPCTDNKGEAGTVLIKGEWHLVPNLAGGVFLWILIPETLIECEGVNFKVRGNVLSPVTAKESGEGLKFEAPGECSTAGSKKAKFKEFGTDTGMGTAKLEANGGLGFEEVCEELKTAPVATAENMAEIMTP